MRSAIGSDQPPAQALQPQTDSAEEQRNSSGEPLCCQSCGSESLRLTEQRPKPSWSVLLALDSECSPWWYAESQEREEKRLWDAAMGEGYYDWYVAHVLRRSESARDYPKAAEPLPRQLFLPGLAGASATSGSFYNDSF